MFNRKELFNHLVFDIQPQLQEQLKHINTVNINDLTDIDILFLQLNLILAKVKSV